jgi:hypothetical protein
MWNFQTRLLQPPNHLPDFFLTTLLWRSEIADEFGRVPNK